MKFPPTLPVLLALLLISVSSAYVLHNGALYCNTTCDDCEDALNNDTYTTVYLNSSLSSPGATCINNPSGFNNKIFDCQGNTITGSGSGYGIYASSKSNITIVNCSLHGFNQGLRVRYTSDSLFFNVTSYNSTSDCAYFHYLSNSTFANNTLHNCSHEGMTLDYSSDNVIENNTLYDSVQQCIEIGGSHRNRIAFNNVHDCLEEGIGFHWTIDLASENNTVENNTLYNVYAGISIWSVTVGAASGNFIANNTISTLPPHECGNDPLWDEGLDIFLEGDSEYECNNVFVDNTGSRGLPIYFTNETVNWSDLEADQVILCNADNSVLTNITVGSASAYRNAFTLHYSDNVTITNSTSSGNIMGFQVHRSENTTIANSTAQDNFVSDFYMGKVYRMYYSPAFYCNNRIENITVSGGYPLYYSNETVDWGNFEASQVILCNADSSNLTNITLYPSPHVSNNGFHVLYTDNATVSSSSAQGTRYGFWLQAFGNHTTLVGNTATDVACTAFYLHNYVANTALQDNTASGGLLGFYIKDLFAYNYPCNPSNTVIGNTAYNNEYGGFFVYLLRGAVFANNTAYGNSGDGFTFRYTANNTISGNIAYSNGYGFLRGGELSGTDWDIFLSYTGSGFLLNLSHDNNLTDNLAYNNLNYQAYLLDSTGNRIYNNVFNATQSGIPIYTNNANNFLNTSLSCGNTSIVGGDCTGGNWYSNYTGTDADGNGIGETNFSAFGMTDCLPLVQALPPPPKDEGRDVECTEDSDCGECEVCSDNECIFPEGACLSDSDCTGEGETCSSCECIPPECIKDSDCPDGYSCEDYVCVEVPPGPPQEEPGPPTEPEHPPEQPPGGTPQEPEPTPGTPGNATEPEESPKGETGEMEVSGSQAGDAGEESLPVGDEPILPDGIFFLAVLLCAIILYFILTRIFPGLPGGKDR